MGIQAQDFIFQVIFKTAHDRYYNNQGHNPQGDSAHGDKGNDGNKGLFPLGLQIAVTDKKFKRHN